MKITPIKRKGCKNVGWIWDEQHLNKLVVPLHHGKPLIYQSETYCFENVYMDKKGWHKISYEKLLEPKGKTL